MWRIKKQAGPLQPISPKLVAAQPKPTGAPLSLSSTQKGSPDFGDSYEGIPVLVSTPVTGILLEEVRNPCSFALINGSRCKKCSEGLVPSSALSQ